MSTKEQTDPITLSNNKFNEIIDMLYEKTPDNRKIGEAIIEYGVMKYQNGLSDGKWLGK